LHAPSDGLLALLIPALTWEYNKSIGRAFLISSAQHRLDRKT